ncbi:hypothetical protein ACCT06_10655 [Rhizobium ruizarguesonis]
MIAAAHRAQADFLEIEAQAKRQFANEYDAAQKRGELAKQGQRNIPEQNVSTLADAGLSAKAIHDARLIRDAETADSGVVRRTLDEKLASGEEPTKAALRKAVNEWHLLMDAEWREWSDREIARRCRVGHELVGNMRAEIERPLTGFSSSDDKRRSDAEWREWSDREIARRCRVGPHLVAKIRGDLSPVTVRAHSEHDAARYCKY